MAIKKSAGTLLYRDTYSGREVLIVHPSGKGNVNASWSIPKGGIDPGETPEQAARRETFEETGIIAGQLSFLGSSRYKNGKKSVDCFVGRAPDAIPIVDIREIDKASYFHEDEAANLLHPDQKIFIDLLKKTLSLS